MRTLGMSLFVLLLVAANAVPAGETITTVATYGGRGVCSDSSGNIYFTSGNYVRRMSTNGTITTVAGNGSSSYSGDGGQALQAGLANPTDIAIDSSGRLYFIDSERVRKIDTNGVITRIAGTGAYGYSGDGGAATNATFALMSYIAVDAAGNVYVSDSNNSRVRKIGTNGIVTTFAGNGTFGFSGNNGPASSAALSWPRGLAFDPQGNLYIADLSNYRIRKVNTSGVISTVAGTGSSVYSGEGVSALSASGYFDDVATDASGNLYILGGYRVRRVNSSGIISTYAGTGVEASTGDGGAPTSAAIDPNSIVCDSSGRLCLLEDAKLRRIGGSVVTPSVGFAAMSGQTLEDPTSATVTVALSAATSQTVTVNYAVTGGTASQGSDFVLASGVLSFAPNQTIRTITMNIVEDYLSEGDETIALTLSSPSNATLGAASYMHTIQDDGDAPPIVTISSPYDHENTNTLYPTIYGYIQDADVGVNWSSFWMTGTNIPFVDYNSISYDPATGYFAYSSQYALFGENVVYVYVYDNAGNFGSAAVQFTGPASDTNPPTITIDFPTEGQYTGPVPLITGYYYDAESGVDWSNFYLTINGITVYSSSQGFYYDSSSGYFQYYPDFNLYGGVTLNAAGVDFASNWTWTTRNFYADGTGPSVSISQPSYGEFVSTNNPTISGYINDYEAGVSSFYFDVNGNYVFQWDAGVYFDYSSGYFSFTSPSVYDTVHLTVYAMDNVGNYGSTYTLFYTPPPDNNPPSIAIYQPAFDEQFADTTVTVTGYVYDSQSGVNNFYLCFNGNYIYSWDPGMYYDAVSGNFSYTATNLYGAIFLELGATDNAGCFANTTTQFTCQPPPPYASFSVSSSTDLENVSTVTLAVLLNETSSETITVDYNHIGGSATVGFDFDSFGGTLTFNPGETSQSIQLTIRDDGSDEIDEDILIELSNPTNALIGSLGTYRYTIADDEPEPAVTFLSGSSQWQENTSTITIPVQISHPSDKGAVVHYYIDSNYGGVINFGPGETSAEISIPNTDDDVDGPDKTFSVSLQDASNLALGTFTEHFYTVLDNEPTPLASFESAASSASELAGTVTIPIILSNPSSLPVSVNYSVTGGTANGASNTGIEIGSISQKEPTAGEELSWEHTVGVGVNRCLFVCVMVSGSLGFTPPTVTFGGVHTTYTALEGTSGGNLYLFTLAAPPVGTFPIEVSISGTGLVSSATAVDFRGVNQLTPTGSTTNAQQAYFAENLSANEPIPMTPRDIILGVAGTGDLANGGINLSAGLNPIGEQQNAFNPLFPFVFSTRFYWRSQSGDTISASISPPTSYGFMKNLRIIAATSNAGNGQADYALADGTITFEPGETEKRIDISVLDDQLNEGAETVQITLSNPWNAVLGVPSEHTFTILDDDNARPVATPADYTLVQGAQVTFTLHATDPEVDPITFTVVNAPEDGVITGAPPTLTYTPHEYFVGVDSLKFVANDPSGSSQPTLIRFFVTSGVVDNQPPVVIVPDNMTVEATSPNGSVVDYVVRASDDISLRPHVTYNHPPGSRFGLGTTNVTVTASDGTFATSNSFSITVEDTAPPGLVLPDRVIIQGTSPEGTTVHYEDAIASDLVTPNPSITYSHESGTEFPTSTETPTDTTVTVTATDNSGNSVMGEFVVTVLPDKLATLNIATPVENQVSKDGQFVFQGSIKNDDDPLTATVKIFDNGLEVAALTPNRIGTVYGAISVGSQPGQHTLQIIVEEDGRSSDAIEVKVWVDHSPPSAGTFRITKRYDTMGWWLEQPLQRVLTNPGWFEGKIGDDSNGLGIANSLDLYNENQSTPDDIKDLAPGWIDVPDSSEPGYNWFAQLKFDPSEPDLIFTYDDISKTSLTPKFSARDAAGNETGISGGSNEVYWTPIVLQVQDGVDVDPETAKPGRIAIQKGDEILVAVSYSPRRLTKATNAVGGDELVSRNQILSHYDVVRLKYESVTEGTGNEIEFKKTTDEENGPLFDRPVMKGEVFVIDPVMEVWPAQGSSIDRGEDRRSPGLYVGLDTGDENDNQIPNYQDSTVKAGNPNLARIVVKPPEGSNNAGNIFLRVKFPFISDEIPPKNFGKVRLFYKSGVSGTPSDETELDPYTGGGISVASLSSAGQTFYVQGTSTSPIEGDVVIQLEYEADFAAFGGAFDDTMDYRKTMYDTVKVTVVNADMKVDGLAETNEDREDHPGKGIRLNDSHEETNGETENISPDNADFDMKKDFGDEELFIDQELVEITGLLVNPSNRAFPSDPDTEILENMSVYLSQQSTSGGSLRVFATDGEDSREILGPGTGRSLDLIEYIKDAGTEKSFARFFVEGVQTGGARLKMEVLKDGKRVTEDFVKFSVYSVKLGEVNPSSGIEDVENVPVSDPAPEVKIELIYLQVNNPVGDGKLSGELTVSGTIKSPLSEITAESTVNTLEVYMNGEPEPIGTIAISSTKTDDGPNYRPFPYSGTFNGTIQIDEIIAGRQNFKLVATESEQKRTGSAEYNVIVEAPVPPTDQPEQPSTTPVNYSTSGGAVANQSFGRDYRPVVINLDGEEELLESDEFSIGTMEGSRKLHQTSGKNVVADESGEKPAIGIVVPRADKAPKRQGVVEKAAGAVLDFGAFQAGAACGIVGGAVSMVTDAGELVWWLLKQNTFSKAWELGDYIGEYFFDNTNWQRKRDEEYKRAVAIYETGKSVAAFLWRLRVAPYERMFSVVADLYSDTDPEINKISEDIKIILQVFWYVFDWIKEEFESASAYDLGYIYGRVVFEILSFFIPVGGQVKAVLTIAKVVHATTIAKVINHLKSSPALSKVAGTAWSKIGNLVEKIVKYTSRLQTCCFTAGTLVLTAHGPMPIETIQPGEYVLSQNETTGEQAYKQVLNTYRTEPSQLYDLHIQTPGDSNTLLQTTGGHPLWVDGRNQFVYAKDLRAGDQLRLSNGASGYVTKTETRNVSSSTQVYTYNLEVEDFHTYFVGAEGIWVHNQGLSCENLAVLYSRFEDIYHDVGAVRAQIQRGLSATPPPIPIDEINRVLNALPPSSKKVSDLKPYEKFSLFLDYLDCSFTGSQKIQAKGELILKAAQNFIEESVAVGHLPSYKQLRELLAGRCKVPLVEEVVTDAQGNIVRQTMRMADHFIEVHHLAPKHFMRRLFQKKFQLAGHPLNEARELARLAADECPSLILSAGQHRLRNGRQAYKNIQAGAIHDAISAQISYGQAFTRDQLIRALEAAYGPPLTLSSEWNLVKKWILANIPTNLQAAVP